MVLKGILLKSWGKMINSKFGFFLDWILKVDMVGKMVRFVMMDIEIFMVMMEIFDWIRLVFLFK